MCTTIVNWISLLTLSTQVIQLETKMFSTISIIQPNNTYLNRCSEFHLNRIALSIYTSDWRNLFIIYDGNDETTVAGILHHLENRDRYILATTVDIGNMNSTKTREVLVNIYSSTTNSSRILFVLNNQTIPFLKMANKFEENKNKTRDSVHNSKCSSWIIVMTTKQDTDLSSLDMKLNIIDRIKCHELSDNKNESVGIQRQRCLEKCMFSNTDFKLNGRNLLIGTVKTPNFDNIIQKLASTLSQALNFSYKFKEPDDQDYGLNIDGRWTGLVGQVFNQEVDMVIAELTMTEERMKVIDFVLPGFLSHGIGVLYKSGIEVESAWFKVFKPLQLTVYVCLFIVLIYVGLMLTVLNNGHTYASNGFFFYVREFVKTLSLLIGFLSVRGNGIWPKTDSSRVFVIVLWMCCVVIAATYIGNLTAKITETRVKKPFNNLAELARLSDWKICFIGDSLIQNIFQYSKNSDMIEIWNRVVYINKSDPLVLHPRGQFHFDKLLSSSEKIAFVEFDAKYYVNRRNDCSLASVETGVISNFNIAIAVPKNSYLKLPLEKMMIKLADIGFFDILNDMRYKDNRPGSCKITVKNRTLVFEDVKGVILVVVFGLFLALIILLIEVIYKYVKHQRCC